MSTRRACTQPWLVTKEWKLEPWPVFGGWIVVNARWVRHPREGWDQEHELIDGVSHVLHASKQDATVHIAKIAEGA
jgi:hypothetical protein